jgi:hypothetical protein
VTPSIAGWLITVFMKCEWFGSLVGGGNTTYTWVNCPAPELFVPEPPPQDARMVVTSKGTTKKQVRLRYGSKASFQKLRDEYEAMCQREVEKMARTFLNAHQARIFANDLMQSSVTRKHDVWREVSNEFATASDNSYTGLGVESGVALL